MDTIGNAKKISDYLHLYLGCECFNHLRLLGVEGNAAYVSHPATGRMVKDINYLKPILRPLSDITDIHIEKIWDELGFNKKYESPAYPKMTKKSFLEKVFNGHQNISFKKFVVLINFLRENEYDCDNLIEAGLAIDKTKLQP